jgi:hypothetical protein
MRALRSGVAATGSVTAARGAARPVRGCQSATYALRQITDLASDVQLVGRGA